jgi:hypothetical protein
MSMTPYSLVNRYLLLTGIHCLHLQGKRTLFLLCTLNTEATRFPRNIGTNLLHHVVYTPAHITFPVTPVFFKSHLPIQLLITQY